MIVMTLVVRDEADILRANIDHHLDLGVDRILAYDNGSTDGTLDLLDEYARAGAVEFEALGDVPFDKETWSDALVRRAAGDLGARWVIMGDADELYVPPPGDRLSDLLANSSHRVLQCRRINLIGAHDRLAAATWRRELGYVSTLSDWAPGGIRDPKVAMPRPYFYYRLFGKIMFRPEGFRSLAPGAHAVTLGGAPAPESTEILIHHYPVRDPAEFIASIPRFADPARRSGGGANVSAKYRRWMSMLEAGVPVARLLDEVLPDSARLAEDLASGLLKPVPPGFGRAISAELRRDISAISTKSNKGPAPGATKEGSREMADANRAERPLSPFMLGKYYRLQLTSVTSILTRIAGNALILGAALVAWWLLAAATSASYFAFADAVLTSWLGDLVMLGSLWALWYHYLAGIRHLIFDAGRGLDVPTAEMLGIACIAGSVVLTVLTLFII